MKPQNRFVGSIAIVSAIAVAGCQDVDINAALHQQSEAKQISADLLVQFTKAADASNRAVMAASEEVAVAAAREAGEAKQALQNDVDRLGPMLRELHYKEESQLLDQFAARYREYQTLDNRVLELAVEGSNLKAQRLSFGAGQKAAAAVQQSLEAAVASAPASTRTEARALAMTALAAVREIQALQAPHIADPDDAAMTRFEQQMATAESAARRALTALAALGPAPWRSHVTAATSRLDGFMSVHAEIIGLSRKNTNVRALILSFDEKRKLAAPCEESLRALRAALAKRGYPAGRTS